MPEIVDGRYLEVLIRPDDEACEAAVGLTLQVAGPSGIAVHTVSVAGEAALAGEFAGRVPIVRGPGGVIVAEGTISATRLTAAVLSMTGDTTRAR